MFKTYRIHQLQIKLAGAKAAQHCLSNLMGTTKVSYPLIEESLDLGRQIGELEKRLELITAKPEQHFSYSADEHEP